MNLREAKKELIEHGYEIHHKKLMADFKKFEIKI
jgi:hypothetical protein